MNTTTDAERDEIHAAIDRLLAGQPTRSTGALNILQLAAEAGFKRWVLTHKHVDLKDEFQRRRNETSGVPTAFQALHSRAVDAEAANKTLTEENRRLREQIDIYAQVIHELTVERERRSMAPTSGGNHYLAQQLDPGAKVTRTDTLPQLGAAGRNCQDLWVKIF